MPAYADTIISTEERAASASQGQTKESMQQRCPEDEVVVSGMSGRFPESSSVSEFAKNLYEGVDMVTEDDSRWPPGIFGLPRRSGKIPELSKFDAPFFSVSPRQAHCMDPQIRLLLEVTHEAIFDAGIHPSALKGRRVGVYVGASESETEEYITQDPEKISGYELTGCCRAMFANRLSYALDLKGPSFAVDTACSSALVALATAWKSICDGEIEAALVAGSSLTLKPQTSLQFHALSMLSPDGSCKAFDAKANGYVRSEAVAAVFLQKRKDAARIYAQVVQAMTNTDGHKGEGITFPSGAVQKSLLQEVYRRAQLDPSNVTYVEAHGTGTKAGDPQEINAIADVFCANRSEPLLIGSVKSNMGHSEPTSGLCAMVKVLLSMQNREIPGNLHFHDPNPDIAPLNDGRLKVVSQNTPWRGPYAAINCFGFGGANVHLLLKASEFAPHSDILKSLKPEPALAKSPSSASIVPEGGSPRLVLTAGRTEKHVESILEEFRRNRNVNFASLLDNIVETEPPRVSFPYRGYTIVGGEDDRIIMNVGQSPGDNLPLWLVFSGMGSQWKGCGRALLDLPPFDDVIQRCRSALLPFGVDVVDVITREEPDPMKSTTYSFVAIATIQVGLVEVLKSIGVKEFDGFVGHSVGELGCGYADGTLTAEQTVLAAYWRGRSVEEAGLSQGKMAAVGLSFEEAQQWVGKYPNVVVACRNSAKSVTISGPKEEVEMVQGKLDAEGIFCRGVDSGGIAFHHPSLRKAAPRLLFELQKVILSPLKRSSKWISSSIPENRWNSGIAQKASAEYLVNNLVSPVLFAEALQKIPDGARVIEVSPHALMQAVLRRALPSCMPIALVRKEAKDVLSHLMESLGKLYISGEKLSMKSLYSSASLPVPLNTPSIASLIKWDHSIDWDVAKFSTSSVTSEFKVNIDLNDPTSSFLEGHAIDGRVLFPATGYITLAWRALAKLVEKKWNELPVTFSDVALHQATVLSANNSGVTFTVRLLLAKGEFEILAGETLAASGKIHVGVKETPERKVLSELMSKPLPMAEEGTLELTQNEVYKELRLRGYQYGGDFRGVRKADLEGKVGQLGWKNNWISLLDTLLQFSLLGSPMKGLYLPTRIRRVYIDPLKFQSAVRGHKEQFVKVNHNSTLRVTMCPGVEIHGLKATMAPRRPPADNPVLEGYHFFPNCLKKDHQKSENLSHEDAVRLLLGLVLENVTSLKVKMIHVLGQRLPGAEDPAVLALSLLQCFDIYPILSADYTLSSVTPPPQRDELVSRGVELVEKVDMGVVAKLRLLVMSQETLTPDDIALVAALNDHAFILADSRVLKGALIDAGFVEVASVLKYNLTLLRKPRLEKNVRIFKIDAKDKNFDWVAPLKGELMSPEAKTPLWLVANGEPMDGLLGMAKCLRREPGGDRLRCIIDPCNKLDRNPSLKNQIEASDLVYNIIDGETVGTMRHLPLPPSVRNLSEYSYLNVLTRGDLSSLTWLVAPTPSTQTDEVVSCSVKYAPLNFRDIMLASGKLPPDALPGSLAQKECILGLEFAGMTPEGVRVMGLVAAGGLASSVEADPNLMWRVPDEWSLREAATVPVVYATAYYALVIRGGLKPEESVLIHAGSGGVGQAAIGIALARGCTVFTTVSTEKKRDFLKVRFPQLKDRNFSNSRDATFEYHIMEQTQGRGVDLVLNSLADELLQASVRCLKEHGRFLEIGKADLANNTALGMSVFLKNVTFHGILLDSLIEGSLERKKELQKVLYDGITSGEVKPLAATSYPYHEAEDAFRFMASGKHIGKVLLEICPEECAIAVPKRKVKRKNCSKSLSIESPPIPETTRGLPSVFRLWPKPNLVYLITGGLGGLGLELCDWLLSRGARKLVLTSRRGITTGYQALCAKRWAAIPETSVRILKHDASTEEGAESLLRQCSSEGPVGGIFHLAMVLEDSVFENQDAGKFQRVCRVKADGAVQLDAASRKLCPDLHIWVTFSSVACGKGNAGQANYGWANSVSERVVEGRVRDGLPGCAIQWGGIADVGILADTLGDVEVAGTRSQSLRSVLTCLDDLIGSNIPVVGSFCLSSKKSSAKGAKGAKSLVASLANILGIRDVSKAPMNVSLGDLGMDSLMAVEIKQTLEREADIVLATEQIRDLTITRIQELDGQAKTSSPRANEANPLVKKESPKGESETSFAWLDFPLVPKDFLRTLNEADYDPRAPPLFVASPIQGTCDVLSQVAKLVKNKVIGLQYPPELPTNDISKLAHILIQKMEAHLPDGPFHLSGYSYGGSVAFEIASQLESRKRRPLSLTLLDGSHSYVSGVIDTYKAKYVSNSQDGGESWAKEREMIMKLGQSDALVTYALQFCTVDTIKLKNSLVNMPSFDVQLDHISNIIMEQTQKNNARSNSHLTIEEIKQSAAMFYDRLLANLDQPATTSTISLPTLLIRAAQNTHFTNVGQDYGLSEVITGDLSVKDVEGTHESFILGPNARIVAQMINEFLASKSN